MDSYWTIQVATLEIISSIKFGVLPKGIITFKADNKAVKKPPEPRWPSESFCIAILRSR